MTTLARPIPGGAWRALRAHAAWARRVVALHHQGLRDATMAERVTAEGERSPRHASPLFPSPVRGIRLQPRLCVTRSPSHPRQLPGYLTVPPLARGLDVSPPWLYDRIATGTMQVLRDPATGL